MSSQKISRLEIAIILFVLMIILTGFLLLFIDIDLFKQYTIEDGTVEWLTVAGLLLGAYTCFKRMILLHKEKGWILLMVAFILGIFLFVAAGEEISWGQRILGIQSQDYFKENNTQGETNFHNLIVGGVRINRIIFSFMLISVLSIYLILFPLLYKSKTWMKRFVNNWGIPLPKIYQVISCVVLFGLTSILPHEKRAELLECGIAFLLFLIIAYPLNDFVFAKK